MRVVGKVRVGGGGGVESCGRRLGVKGELTDNRGGKGEGGGEKGGIVDRQPGRKRLSGEESTRWGGRGER